MNWERTCELIPNGVQTLSKMPSKHVKGVYPLYIERGEGAYVWGSDGKKYLDYPCGLGSVLLGYNIGQINQAIIRQLDKGIIFSLPHKLEGELAERIVDLFPSAEMVRFLKTGSEACSAAIKIARAYTSREFIVCCGYHGWHDWYNYTTPKNKGVPKQKVIQCKYNDLESFKKAFTNRKIAAVIMEPYVLEEPSGEFLKKIRKMCTQNGTLLIFDEIITGFRTWNWSAQSYFKIIPDMTCLGKAMANGMPISAVCGRSDIMKELESDCFVSSTFGGELLSIAAALETIKIIEEQSVIQHIWRMGETLKSIFNSIAQGLDGVECIGYPPRTFFLFPSEVHKGLFWQECMKMGVLFGYAQFVNFSHKQGEMDKTIAAMQKGLQMVRKYWTHPEDGLHGEAPQETFRLVVEKEKK